jgi:hypothetical protein
MDGQQHDDLNPVNGFARGVVIAALITFTMALVVMGGCTAVRADAVNRVNAPRIDQPYGGCWEGALYTHTQGAQDCRDLGWTMRRHLIINPRGVAWTDLPKCVTEDSDRCYWAAGRMGDRHGQSFVNVGTTDRPILFLVKRFR